MFSIWWPRITTFLACYLLAAPLQAQVEVQLVDLARTLAKELKREGHTAATLQVESPPNTSSSGPTLVKEVLGAELQKLEITIQKVPAPIGISVKLKIHPVPDQDNPNVISSVALILSVELVNRFGTPVGSISIKDINVTDPAEVSRILGIPIETTVVTPTVVNSSDIRVGAVATAVLAAIEQPDQIADGTVVRAKEDGLFGFEVLVNGKPKAISVTGGYAAIKLTEQDECEIRLVNDAPFEVGVRVTLDGMDSFWFTKQKIGYWIVGPKSTAIVRGWQLDESEARKFEIVPFEKSVAVKAGVTGEIGVIAASFYRAYPEDATIPREDNPPPPVKSLAFGDGTLITNAIKIVKRKFGKTRACVPVRYDRPKQVDVQ